LTDALDLYIWGSIRRVQNGM